MTTLRSFQEEIDKVRSVEIQKQRAKVAQEREETEKSKVTLKSKEAEHKTSNKGEEDVKVLNKGKLKSDAKLTTPQAKEMEKPVESDMKGEATSPVEDRRSVVLDTSETEEKIQRLLLSTTPGDYDSARDLVAGLLTFRKGEALLRIGPQPSHEHLFSGHNIEAEDGWCGISRTTEEVHTLVTQLTRAVEEVGGKLCVMYDGRESQHPRASVLLRLPPPNVSLTPEVRCAVVGNVDSGKSTMLGVLTRGGLDDGRGLARVALFRHKHEVETGRTSSVGMEILGFDTAGAPILPKKITGTSDLDVVRREKLGWEQISLQSAKIVTFIDLAGHERYLKTTLYGLTSGSPSCVVLMVGGNAGLIGMSKEHLAIALALGVPVIICITKIDMTPANKLAETVKQVTKIVKSPGCKKTPVFIDSLEAAVETSQVFAKERLCPIFRISNVTGDGLDLVRTFLNLLPASEDEEKFDASQPLEYSVTEVWSVPYVGTVVNGILNSGVIKKGDTVLVGPDSNGNFLTTSIRDMQRKRAEVSSAEAGQTVSLALKRVKRADVRKGMVIAHKSETLPRAHRQFEGTILVLYHNSTLQPNYQAMLHCGAVRQTVRIVSIDHPQNLLRTGDRATVHFEFISRPEFIKVGMKLLFREGKTKGLGVITRLL